MYKLLNITALSFLFFFIEFIVSNFLSEQLTPNLLILLIVFFNLYLGIRYSLITAFLCGVIQDSFSFYPFGLNIVSFLFCAYMTTFIKRYLNYIGSGSSRVVIVLLVSVVNVLIHYLLVFTFTEVDFGAVLVRILVPEVVMTVVVTGLTFRLLKRWTRFAYL